MFFQGIPRSHAICVNVSGSVPRFWCYACNDEPAYALEAGERDPVDSSSNNAILASLARNILDRGDRSVAKLAVREVLPPGGRGMESS